SQSPKIIFVSSEAHRIVSTDDLLKFDIKNASATNTFMDYVSVYGISKLAIHVYADYISKNNTKAVVILTNPGNVWTNIYRNCWRSWYEFPTRIKCAIFMRAPEEGAQSTIHALNLGASLNRSYVTEHVYGEAASLLDRAFERAFSLLVSNEVAVVEIRIPKTLLENSIEELSLKCKVQLIILEYNKSVYECSVDEKLSMASKYKNLGIALYREAISSKQLSAYLFFSQAVKWLCTIDLKESGEKRKEIEELKAQCYNNIGLYLINQKNYPLVIEATTKVLKLDKQNVKALYRRAVANTEIQNYELAEEDLRSALLFDPNNGPVKKQIEEVKKREKVVSDKYALAMKKFLS
ncbi:hypothetical protein SK128_001155, partial [Halocaridina rubra]